MELTEISTWQGDGKKLDKAFNGAHLTGHVIILMTFSEIINIV
jgi:hypothetical protein